eukprot:TRINITY_DN22638_c0_g1_i2.p1 TRINITY_DN22638_c0_g1~~TRINITY_DN22638_c0_g1_i2.p1  ORF type:complete len:630 (+),score=158.09 TRINITY_DN22638_c0_g1_i2:64-1953(+)
MGLHMPPGIAEGEALVLLRSHKRSGRQRPSCSLSRKYSRWVLVAAACCNATTWRFLAFASFANVRRHHSRQDLIRKLADQPLPGYLPAASDSLAGRSLRFKQSRPGRFYPHLLLGGVALAVFGIEWKSRKSRGASTDVKSRDELREFLLQAFDDQHQVSGPVTTDQDTHHHDSFRRTISEWWDGLTSESADKGFRRRKSTASGPDAQDESQKEEETAGVLNVLASVKTSVQAAVLGIGSSRDSEDETQGGEADQTAPLSPPIQSFPSPEGLLASAQSAADAAAAAVANATQAAEEQPDSKAEADEDQAEAGAETPDWWESARDAVLGMAEDAEDSPPEQQKQLVDGKPEKQLAVDESEDVPQEQSSSPEWWEVARDAVLSAGSDTQTTDASEEEKDELRSSQDTAESSSSPVVEPVPEAVEPEPIPLPEAPGMEKANLIVRVDIEPQRKQAANGAEGVDALMASADRDILEAMAQVGWEVEVVDESGGLYMLSLPSVRYEVMGTTVMIPAPRFLTTFRDTRSQTAGSEEFQARAQGDLVLQNGEDIFSLELGFPFRSKLTISAAGWTRANIGWAGDEVVTSNYVEVGIQVPKVPGLSSILEYFVKNYGIESTQDCAAALAKAAESRGPG